jgi:signal transduction histidine kinase
MKTDLAEKNEEREQMLAQIAHEIRNPLGGIELMAGLVKESMPADDKSAQHIQKILEEVHGLKQQLTLFLEYSKPLEVNPENINVRELVIEIESIFESSIKSKGIHFSLDDQLKKVFFDYGHLKQTLINLVSNSIDAIEKNGKIAISAFPKNGQAILSIENNGPAIAEKNQKKIFNPFFTTKASGTGLGLAVCQKFCALNNADIELDNLYKTGTRFLIYINKKTPGGI